METAQRTSALPANAAEKKPFWTPGRTLVSLGAVVGVCFMLRAYVSQRKRMVMLRFLYGPMPAHPQRLAPKAADALRRSYHGKHFAPPRTRDLVSIYGSYLLSGKTHVFSVPVTYAEVRVGIAGELELVCLMQLQELEPSAPVQVTIWDAATAEPYSALFTVSQTIYTKGTPVRRTLSMGTSALVIEPHIPGKNGGDVRVSWGDASTQAAAPEPAVERWRDFRPVDMALSRVFKLSAQSHDVLVGADAFHNGALRAPSLLFVYTPLYATRSALDKLIAVADLLGPDGRTKCAIVMLESTDPTALIHGPWPLETTWYFVNASGDRYIFTQEREMTPEQLKDDCLDFLEQ